jgi:hypothetical protein
VCNYVSYWPAAPADGQYTAVADVSYTVGNAGQLGNQAGTVAFQVAPLNAAVGVLNTANGLRIPAGQALVQDAMAPQQYFFSASANQQYTTQLTCPETAIVTNQASLTAATGQTVVQAATVQKLCYDLQVRVAQAASPFVGKWTWDVSKVASVQSLTLKPSATAWDKYVKQQMDLAIASGQDPQAAMELITGGVNATAMSASTMDGSMTGEVTYKVSRSAGDGDCDGVVCPYVCPEASFSPLTLLSAVPVRRNALMPQFVLAAPTAAVVTLDLRIMSTCLLDASSAHKLPTPVLTRSPLCAVILPQVTYTRTPPGGFVAGAAAFQAVGDVFITNSSPLNAQLKEVTVSISNPFGGSPYTTKATCPIFTVAAGQTLQCRYVASPSFNPIGAQVVGIAHYINQRNGVPTGATTPFSSAAVTMAGGASPSQPQAALRGPTTQRPGTPVPSMVIPSVSRRRLLSPAVDAALSNVVRQVSVTTTNGHAHRARNAPGSVTTAAAPKQSGRGQRVVKDIMRNIAAALEETSTQDKKESGNGNMFLNIMKNITYDSEPAVASSDSGNSTQEAIQMLVHLLPKLPSMGINITSVDYQDILSNMRDMLPDEGFGALVKKLAHLPSIKLPSIPKFTLPMGPTITINSTGPAEDDYEERTMEGLSRVLTTLTNIIEHSNKSTITITTKEMTPEAMLTKTLESIAKRQHRGSVSNDADDDLVVVEDERESGSIPQSASISATEQSSGDMFEQAPAAPQQLQGLSDECIDVRDAFAAGNGYTTGMVVSGALPSGRICDTTTFTYTVRYGPYAECFDRKAINKAQFTTVDTNTTSEASTDVNVIVAGCGPAVTATIKSYAVWAKKGYAWTVQKSASPAKLQLGAHEQGPVEYTVAYTRNEVLTAPKLSATVQFDNLNLAAAASVNTFNYKVTSNCPDGSQTKTGTFSCPSGTIPVGGAPLSCKFKVDLPCSAPGVLLANAVAEDKAVRSNAFNFPAPEPTEVVEASESDDQLATGECVMVSGYIQRCSWHVRCPRLLVDRA